MRGSQALNFLFLLTDQLTITVLKQYAAGLGDPMQGRYAKTPNLDRLAAQGVVFENCYCQSPLCVPSRASLCAGRHPSAVGSYDNGSEFGTANPTFAHALRARGYRTVLAGKMHFVGLDQLHGFEERLTPDIYPSTLEWTPDWSRGAYLNHGACVKKLQPPANTGRTRTQQMAYDDQVQRTALKHFDRMVREQRNGRDGRPFFLGVSFTHPHDPFRIPSKYWNLYDAQEIPPPAVGPDPVPSQFQRWINTHHGVAVFPPTVELVQAARHAYFGMISYIDEMVGVWLDRLARTKLLDRTCVLFSSDHGEMLGEHGMWFKRTYHEPSVRVPLIVALPGGRGGPGGRRGRVDRSIVSLVDLFPTFCDLAGAALPDRRGHPLDGRSFAPALHGRPLGGPERAFSEYLGEGTLAPLRMVREGRWKYVYAHGVPAPDGGRRRGRKRAAGGSAPEELLFDLQTDPFEQTNLAKRPEQRARCRSLRRTLFADGWDPARLQATVAASQQARLTVVNALMHRGPDRAHSARATGSKRTNGVKGGTPAPRPFVDDADFWGAQPGFPERH
ncbi:MAG: choline-sulfatase [Planctomycetota bacterium]